MSPVQPPPRNPYAAPQARVQEYVADDSLELADRVIRLGAYLLDAAVLGVPAIIIAVMVPALAASAGDGGSGSLGAVGQGLIILFGIYALGVLVVNLIWLHRYGQTIGKRLLKIAIVRTSGERCSLLRIIFARIVPVSLLGAIPFIGWLFTLGDPLFIFREDRRCLHDLIADTMVVRAA